ncbi:MAG: substrate-binding domain-containing protein [Oscillospiraceae bacterium]|nr:substrate-binding domain-containing protein [Oscillospiraceae bacterium]
MADIFISYRRDGGDMAAMHIYQALKERGYDLFYDVEVLRSGKFNEALLKQIQSCKDFIIVLSPHALDRCEDKNDWVRQEIAEAIKEKKNIIPVMMNGFQFPENLPEDINELRFHAGLTSSTEYFQESINRLCNRFLTVKPRKKGKWIVPAIVGAILCALVIGILVKPGTKPSRKESDSSAQGSTIYVLGPTPDHGWTAQAGAFASVKCDEINKEGTYKAVYIPASSGEEQVDQCNTIIANGDAAVVVMMALDDSAKAGQEALHAEEIPFISFDRIIETTEEYAALNYSGNNRQCGAGIAYWLQKNGMEPGDTVVVLYGDNGIACSRRQEGFEQFLRGELKYEDELKGEFETTEVWKQDALDDIFNGYTVVCNWSSDGAYSYVEQKFDEIVATAKANAGELFIYSMDDEMIFGVLNYLEAGASAETLADLEKLEVYISAIGGMQELYDIMAGTDGQSALADKYFDDMMSVSFNPKMMQTAIELGVKLADGDWDYEVGSGEYAPVFIVDKTNAAEIEGFLGHA